MPVLPFICDTLTKQKNHFELLPNMKPSAAVTV